MIAKNCKNEAENYTLEKLHRFIFINIDFD